MYEAYSRHTTWRPADRYQALLWPSCSFRYSAGMRGMLGTLYGECNEKTRKYYSLTVWVIKNAPYLLSPTYLDNLIFSLHLASHLSTFGFSINLQIVISWFRRMNCNLSIEHVIFPVYIWKRFSIQHFLGLQGPLYSTPGKVKSFLQSSLPLTLIELWREPEPVDKFVIL